MEWREGSRIGLLRERKGDHSPSVGPGTRSALHSGRPSSRLRGGRTPIATTTLIRIGEDDGKRMLRQFESRRELSALAMRLSQEGLAAAPDGFDKAPGYWDRPQLRAKAREKHVHRARVAVVVGALQVIDDMIAREHFSRPAGKQG